MIERDKKTAGGLGYTIAMAWGILTGGIIAATWVPAIIGAVFAIMLLVFYILK